MIKKLIADKQARYEFGMSALLATAAMVIGYFVIVVFH